MDEEEIIVIDDDTIIIGDPDHTDEEEGGGDVESQIQEILAALAGKVAKAGDTMSGRLNANGKITAKTSGGSYVSQKDTKLAAIEIEPPAVIDGSRFDAILAGKSTDGSTWCIGVMNNAIHIGRYASEQTANAFTNVFTIPLTITANLANLLYSIARSGDTITATRTNGTTLTFSLADKFPVAGGTMTGSLVIDRNNGTTTSVDAYSQLVLGNAKAQGVAGNSRGVISIYARSAAYTNIWTDQSLTASNNVYLPAGNGTLALTSQIPAVVNALNSTATGSSLSAAQGKALNDKFASYLPLSGGTLTGNLTVATGNADSWLIAGKASESRGNLRLYQGAYNTRLLPTTLSAQRNIYLPNAGGTLSVASGSSRRIKENIRDMTEEEAAKILEIEIVKFDFIGEHGGGGKNHSGVIAEDVIEIIPEAVHIFEGYDEEAPIDEETNPSPEVDYRKFIPYLIKTVQMQQKKIEELERRLECRL